MVLARGEEISAGAVVSNADPRHSRSGILDEDSSVPRCGNCREDEPRIIRIARVHCHQECRQAICRPEFISGPIRIISSALMTPQGTATFPRSPTWTSPFRRSRIPLQPGRRLTQVVDHVHDHGLSFGQKRIEVGDAGTRSGDCECEARVEQSVDLRLGRRPSASRLKPTPIVMLPRVFRYAVASTPSAAESDSGLR